MAIKRENMLLTADLICDLDALRGTYRTQMYIDGYQVKLVSDTSYGSLWEVSFTLKEF